ncbi:hypothetical protein ASG12_03835 [Williamsia sp. Leaf354]|uniref:hypothetical protein n=1 Tax=Williamsia sp. Leaf354 TaxID=1736349 RepID=UPI0006FCA6CF|nr:hypothetical protein [Williamsia sp. Leaf354]KQR99902.1 hypothetical protein ASG12_03835 [Williamsia sp. Leaf354]
MAVTMSFSSPHLRHAPPMSAARQRRARLRRAAIWGQVGWAAFMFGSAAFALGLAGVATGLTVAGIAALVVWVVLYGLTIYSIRSRAMARGDRTLQEHIARVKRSRYRRAYPGTGASPATNYVEPYRPPAAFLAPGAD